ncbi:unnamed protein product [Polarella glacialis]|uniref:Uncharacterized protein n=1 Tax=Polarella glacialis TaxID=89957 RepID=A0A813DWJ6_POLGL|nr:unnamed protein product [Polarella glacialis]
MNRSCSTSTDGMETMRSQMEQDATATVTQPAQPPVASGLRMLKSRAATLLTDARAKAAEVVELATVTAQAAKVQVMDAAISVKLMANSYVEQTCETAAGLKQKALKAAEPVTSRVLKVLDGAREKRAFAVGYATSAKSSAGKSYERLRSQGVKVWTKEAVQAGTGVAKQTLNYGRSTATAAYSRALTSATGLVDSSRESARAAAAAAVDRANRTARLAKAKTAELQSTAQAVAKDGKFQATAAGAASGAAALGVSGGATGLTAGSAIGAAVGLVPALFTFGLSIPIGAAIGGGAGLVVGTVVGTATGAVGGGAAGFGVYTKRDDIRAGTQSTLSKVNSASDFVKGKANDSAGYMKGKVSEVRTRFSRTPSGTGGSAVSEASD